MSNGFPEIVTRIARAAADEGGKAQLVAGAVRDLTPDILQHHVGLHDAEPPAVDRWNRTMAAQMLAPPARLGMTGRQASVGGRHMGVVA